MRNKYMNKIVVTICIIIIVAVGLFYFFEGDKLGKDGKFELIIASEDKIALFQEELTFKANETLYDVLKQNFDITCASSTYEPDPTCSDSFRFFSDGKLVEGKVILGITGDEFSVITDWKMTFLAIEVFENETFRLTTKGVNSYELVDGETIRIIVTRVTG